MVPAQPPLPTASNLPSQPWVGNQTSILISESDVGFNVAATRQRAGKLENPAVDPEPGGNVRPPAGIVSARVIVPTEPSPSMAPRALRPGARLVNPSHDVAARPGRSAPAKPI